MGCVQLSERRIQQPVRNKIDLYEIDFHEAIALAAHQAHFLASRSRQNVDRLLKAASL
jgi:hypothetical protein